MGCVREEGAEGARRGGARVLPAALAALALGRSRAGRRPAQPPRTSTGPQRHALVSSRGPSPRPPWALGIAFTHCMRSGGRVLGAPRRDTPWPCPWPITPSEAPGALLHGSGVRRGACQPRAHHATYARTLRALSPPPSCAPLTCQTKSVSFGAYILTCRYTPLLKVEVLAVTRDPIHPLWAGTPAMLLLLHGHPPRKERTHLFSICFGPLALLLLCCCYCFRCVCGCRCL